MDLKHTFVFYFFFFAPQLAMNITAGLESKHIDSWRRVTYTKFSHLSTRLRKVTKLWINLTITFKTLKVAHLLTKPGQFPRQDIKCRGLNVLPFLRKQKYRMVFVILLAYPYTISTNLRHLASILKLRTKLWKVWLNLTIGVTVCLFFFFFIVS